MAKRFHQHTRASLRATTLPVKGRILAVDYGEKRVGLAVSDPMGIIASGIGTITCTPDIAQIIASAAAEREVVCILVGMPRALSGEDSAMTRTVNSFIEALRAASPIPVETLDERFTSTRATQALLEMGLPKKKRQEKARVDEIAAVVLLQDYLNMHP